MPNIVLFVVDDMGWQDTSVPFWTEKTLLNKRYRTPNMERLAAEGIRFSHARAHAICSPTRVAMMTGQSPARSRVTNWTKDRDVIPAPGDGNGIRAPRDWNFNGLQPPGSAISNSVEAPTLAALLQRAGYRTVHVGKAHWGAHGTPGGDPTNLGFDDNVAGWGAGAPGSYLGADNFGNQFAKHTLPWGVPGLEAYHGQDIFLTEALTREAVKRIEEAVDGGQPFFLHFSHYAVHAPLATDRRFEQNYPDLSGAELRYATMIEGMDKSLGDVMQAISNHDLGDDTVIVFVSDNGGVRSSPTLGNAPLRGGKGAGYEGGLRVPMIVKAPGAPQPGTTCPTNVTVEDLFPTLLALADAEIPVEYADKVDGQDITPLLSGRGDFDVARPLFFHQPHFHSGAAFSAVVQNNWKLIFWHSTGTVGLFDLDDDLAEERNLADSLPEKSRHMTSILRRYLLEVDAQMPTRKGTDEDVAVPTKAAVPATSVPRP